MAKILKMFLMSMIFAPLFFPGQAAAFPKVVGAQLMSGPAGWWSDKITTTLNIYINGHQVKNGDISPEYFHGANILAVEYRTSSDSGNVNPRLLVYLLKVILDNGETKYFTSEEDSEHKLLRVTSQDSPPESDWYKFGFDDSSWKAVIYVVQPPEYAWTDPRTGEGLSGLSDISDSRQMVSDRAGTDYYRRVFKLWEGDEPTTVPTPAATSVPTIAQNADFSSNAVTPVPEIPISATSGQAKVVSAEITGAGDDVFDCYINGVHVVGPVGYFTQPKVPVSPSVFKQNNIIAFDETEDGLGNRGIAYVLTIKLDNGQIKVFTSAEMAEHKLLDFKLQDETLKTKIAPKGWKNYDFDDNAWTSVMDSVDTLSGQPKNESNGTPIEGLQTTIRGQSESFYRRKFVLPIAAGETQAAAVPTNTSVPVENQGLSTNAPVSASGLSQTSELVVTAVPTSTPVLVENTNLNTNTTVSTSKLVVQAGETQTTAVPSHTPAIIPTNTPTAVQEIAETQIPTVIAANIARAEVAQEVAPAAEETDTPTAVPTKIPVKTMARKSVKPKEIKDPKAMELKKTFTASVDKNGDELFTFTLEWTANADLSKGFKVTDQVPFFLQLVANTFGAKYSEDNHQLSWDFSRPVAQGTAGTIFYRLKRIESENLPEQQTAASRATASYMWINDKTYSVRSNQVSVNFTGQGDKQ